MGSVRGHHILPDVVADVVVCHTGPAGHMRLGSAVVDSYPADLHIALVERMGRAVVVVRRTGRERLGRSSLAELAGSRLDLEVVHHIADLEGSYRRRRSLRSSRSKTSLVRLFCLCEVRFECFRLRKLGSYSNMSFRGLGVFYAFETKMVIRGCLCRKTRTRGN